MFFPFSFPRIPLLSRKENGTILSMGWGVDGQLGNGSTDNQFTPGAVKSLDGVKIKKISSRVDFALALSG